MYESLLTEEATGAAESQIGICCGTDRKNKSVLKRISLFFVLQIYAQSTTGGLVPLSATTGTISIDFLNTKTSFIYFFKSWCWYSKWHGAVKLFSSGEVLKIQVRSVHYPALIKPFTNGCGCSAVERAWDTNKVATKNLLSGIQPQHPAVKCFLTHNAISTISLP